MSTILSKKGSVRGVEGGVGKALESFKQKRKQQIASPALQRLREVHVKRYLTELTLYRVYRYVQSPKL